METSAQAFGRALAVWGQWLHQWRHTRAPSALQMALACREIAAEKLAIWHTDLRLSRSAMRAELALDKMMREIRHDERALRATGLTALGSTVQWSGNRRAKDALDALLEAAAD
jgi:hypothetical protein